MGSSPTGEHATALKPAAQGAYPEMSLLAAWDEVLRLKAGNVSPTVGDLIDAYVEGHLKVRRKAWKRTTYMLDKHTKELRGEKARNVDRTVGQHLWLLTA